MPFMLEKDDFFVPQEGKNVLRILPSWRGDPESEWFLDVPTHYQVTPEARALICRGMVGKHCPVDDFMQSLYQSPLRVDRERATRMAPVRRIMMNVHPYGSEAVKVWSIGERMLQDLLALAVEGGYGDLTDPVRGRYLVLYRLGDGKNTQYSVRAIQSASKVHIRDWHKKMYDLDKYFQPPSAIEMREILRGQF
jgi:hypothetical protein